MIPSAASTEPAFQADEAFARRLDSEDHLFACRRAFELPRRDDDEPVIYLCGNSLGLMPSRARQYVEEELDAWSTLGVDAHFRAKTPWYSYHEVFRETGARLVGAQVGEVVMMNSLTVNLHLMLSTFYQPNGPRFRILMDAPTFPSDLYAVQTHMQLRGIQVEHGLVQVQPRTGEHCLRESDLLAVIEEAGEGISVVLLSAVNFLTGQAFDVQRITAAAQARGCIVGWDLAHAAGNMELALHDWNVDFAVWCNYKYMNAGPGAVGGCFIHQKHGRRTGLPRLAGWWGNDPKKRFRMQLEESFVPRAGADGWQVSNPPILSMAPLRASLEIFDEVGMHALRRKTLRMTPYMRFLIEQSAESGLEVITPREPDHHGCQLSLRVRENGRARFEMLESAGVVADFREPDIIRVAPAPLYNTYHEVWRAARILCRA